MTLNRFALAAVLGLGAVASASAADLGYKKPSAIPVMAQYNWTGIYVGALAGANILNTKNTIPAYPSTYTQSSTGVALGGKVGGNYQFSNNIVVGLEGSLLWINNKSTHLTGGAGGELYRVNADYQGNVMARAGYAFDRVLPYVKAGYAFTNLTKLAYIPMVGGQKSATFSGWAVGAGIDYALTNNIILGLDYTYASYSKKTFVYGGPNTLKPNTNTILASVSYKF